MNPKVITVDYNASENHLPINLFDRFSIETNIAKFMIFKGERPGIRPNFTMHVALEFKYLHKLGRDDIWNKVENVK